MLCPEILAGISREFKASAHSAVTVTASLINQGVRRIRIKFIRETHDQVEFLTSILSGNNELRFFITENRVKRHLVAEELNKNPFLDRIE